MDYRRVGRHEPEDRITEGNDGREVRIPFEIRLGPTDGITVRLLHTTPPETSDGVAQQGERESRWEKIGIFVFADTKSLDVMRIMFGGFKRCQV